MIVINKGTEQSIQTFKDKYNPYKLTALTRDKLSKPMSILHSKGLLQGEILDVGCGNGFDVEHLKQTGLHIDGYDKFNNTYKNEELLNKHYNILTCNYVFNVIWDLQEHKELIKKIKSIGDNTYISVRSDVKAVNKNTWHYEDNSLGWWSSKGSFQRFYDRDMVSGLFGDFGKVKYLADNSSLKLFRLK